MYVFIYCIRVRIYTFNVQIHMFIQKSSVCIDRDTHMCREVPKEGSTIYICVGQSSYTYIYRTALLHTYTYIYRTDLLHTYTYIHIPGARKAVGYI